MNQTSPAATGTAGAATAAVATLLAIFSQRFSLGLSAAEQVSLAAGIVTGAHWLGRIIATRGAAKPAATAQ